MRPLLFVTGYAPAYRVGAFARLHEREGIELALFGGRSLHGGPDGAEELPVPHRRVRPHTLAALAGGGGYRAVVCPTGGRLAPLATWAGARRGRIPLILWASLWSHPRTLAHAATYAPLRRLYRSADAVVTYGPHVSAYVAARGADNVYVAPQSVDNAFWGAPEIAPQAGPGWRSQATTRFLFVGRPAPEKGLEVLLAAWRASGLGRRGAALVLAGAAAEGEPAGAAPGANGGLEEDSIVRLGRLAAAELRAVYAACDVLVVPSVTTRTFREPWGLVVNEAMNRGLCVIATDAVGAAAGGLVRERRNGLIVPAADSGALAGALSELAGDPALRARLGEAGREDVLAYTHDAWAAGFSRALASLGLSRSPVGPPETVGSV